MGWSGRFGFYVGACVVGGCLGATVAYAYIDPGTGGVIAGSIWPLIVAMLSAAGAFVIKYFWSPIRRFFSRKKRT